MESLFIEQAQFEKVARRLLSQDATKWTKEILDEFFTEFPYFMSQNIDLQFKKRDDSKGYAVATIDANGLSVPVIVTNYELSPFDVVYKDGVTLPLTQETLGAISGSDSAFAQVIRPDPDSGNVDLLFSRPLVDLQPRSGVSKYASVIDRISDGITSEHKADLLANLSDAEVKAGYELNGTVDVLAKIADVTPRPKTYFKESLSKVIPRDIQYVEKLGRFNYRATFGNSEIDDPIVVDMTANQAKEYNGIVGVGHDIEKKATFTSTKGAAFVVSGQHDKLVIMNVDGLRKHAWLDTDTSAVESCDKTFRGEMPQQGDYGVWTDGNTATKPFEIVGLVKSAKHYEVNTYNGLNAVTYLPLRSVEEITKHAEYENTYYIPTKYSFVKVGESADIERGADKSDTLATNYYTRDDVGLYNLQGPAFSKYASNGHDITSLPLAQASWASLQCQASESSVTKMASAPSNVRIPFECTLKSPVMLDKAAALLSDEYAEYSSTIKEIAVDLVKEASTLSDPQSVDAILALNMVTKENILEFVAQIPTYEQVVSDLAKLLLTIRMGLSTVPELAAVKAMKGLSTVVEVLRGMGKLNKAV